jgi:uncharacterized protein with PQ loop repeat
MHAIGEIFGFIGGFIGIATGLPQMLRIRRLGHADGLELSPWLLMLVLFGAWTSFGFKAASPSIMVANLLTFFTTALVVVAITGNTFKSWSLIFLVGATAGLFVFYGPVVLVNLVLVLLTAARLPQLIRTWLNRATAKVTAVSIPSLVVALTSMVFWMGFAVLTENGLVVVSTTVSLAITLLTALVELKIAKQAAISA